MIIIISFLFPLPHFSIIWNSQTKTKYFNFRNFWLAGENYSYSWWGSLLKKTKTRIWYFFSCFIALKKSYVKIKMNSKWFHMTIVADVVVIAWRRVQNGKYFPSFSYFETYTNNSKIWKTRKIFANIAQGNVR